MTTYNDGKTLREAIVSELESLSDSDLVNTWGEYCDANNSTESLVYPFDVETFDDRCGNMTPWEIASNIDMERFNYHDDWFRLHNGWIQSTNDPTDFIEISDLADWIETDRAWDWLNLDVYEDEDEDEE